VSLAVGSNAAEVTRVHKVVSDRKSKATNRQQSRWIILIIFAICVLPVMAAWWILKELQEKGEFATGNYGELITPVIPLRDAILKTSAGKDFAVSQLKGRWTLIVFGPAECSDRCRKNLYKTRQVRLALGNKDMYRVRRLWITNDVSSLGKTSWIQKEHPDLLVASEREGNKEFVDQFVLPKALDPMMAQRIYIIDPLENIMISYPSDQKAEYILKDLKRLLFVSHIG
jgi:cytochrome oxidase Cu insertion factor (SCO1/SenC/PrrC family)